MNEIELAEQGPENEDYFKDPALQKKFGTRGVIHTWANPDGTQKIESTGPLNIERMKTIDEEITAGALDYLEKRKEDGVSVASPDFALYNRTDLISNVKYPPKSPGLQEKVLSNPEQ